MKNSAPKIDYPIQFLILIGLVIGFIVVSSFAAVGVWWGITGKSIFSMEKDMLNPAFANAVKWTQLVAATIMFFLPALIFAAIVNRNPFQQMGFQPLFTGKQFLIVVGIALIALGLSGALGTLNEMIPISAKWAARFKKMETAYLEQIKVMAVMKNFNDYLFSLIVIALAPAFVEEIFFRGTMQRFLQNWFKQPIVAVIITSFIFSAIHFSYYGFLPRFALGIILGLIFIYTNNIWFSILAHFINNGVAVTGIYFYTRMNKSMDEALNETVPLYVGLIVLPIIIALLILLKKESENNGANLLGEGEPKLAIENNPFLEDTTYIQQ